jgi:hypothetical protein
MWKVHASTPEYSSNKKVLGPMIFTIGKNKILSTDHKPSATEINSQNGGPQ